MILLGLYHSGYLFFTNRGKEILKHILPKFSDIVDAIDNILYHLNIKEKRVEFGKYDYMEKAEYWALVWGTAIMGLTGFVLWFPSYFVTIFPSWSIKVSEIIHFYEAILATLAILVWHFFFVIFHPKEYPMSLVWINGKISVHHYREHHEKHFKSIVAEWINFKNEKIDINDLSHTTILFLETLKKNNSSFEQVIQNEIENDLEFRKWFEERGKDEEKIS